MIQIIKDDITKLKVDAIVNAANSSLMGGGGVDGAIHRAAGPDLLGECKAIVSKIKYLPAGQSVITKGYNLAAQYVIHTVGPVWGGGHNRESTILANAYLNSLKLAEDYSIRAVAFPNISTGIYGYPMEEACDVVYEAISNFIKNAMFITRIIFCCYDKENYNLYMKKWNNNKLLIL